MKTKKDLKDLLKAMNRLYETTYIFLGSADSVGCGGEYIINEDDLSDLRSCYDEITRQLNLFHQEDK